MQKITPFFWFEKEAEQAANFYVEVFNGNPGMKKKSKVVDVVRIGKDAATATGNPEGGALTVAFELEGQKFTALNGGAVPQMKMSGGVSFVVDCKTQEEVDHFWKKLGEEGGEPGQCGWINRDRFGVTWQITPSALIEYISDTDPAKAGRAMAAMMQMTKLDIAALQKAYEGK